MSRIASLLAPEAHLLDLAGPAQVLSTAVGFGRPCTLRCLAEQAHVPTAQGLSLVAQLVWLRLGGVSFMTLPRHR